MRGKPWIEDMFWFPTSRLKVEFIPSEPGAEAVELSQEQLFSICDFSPDWTYSGVETKVFIQQRGLACLRKCQVHLICQLIDAREFFVSIMHHLWSFL